MRREGTTTRMVGKEDLEHRLKSERKKRVTRRMGKSHNKDERLAVEQEKDRGNRVGIVV